MSQAITASGPAAAAMSAQDPALELAALRVEALLDARAQRLHPSLRLAVRLALGDELARVRRARRRRRRPRRAPGYVAPIRSGAASIWISRPEKRSSYWRVGLGAELGSHAEHHVRIGQQLREGGVVAGRADAERIARREGALAHVGGGDRRAQALGERAQLGPGAGALDAAARPEDGPLGGGEQPGGLGEDLRRAARQVARARRRAPLRARPGPPARRARPPAPRGTPAPSAA